ncbi:MAG: putative membrane protein [Porticoccaceae bacterium]
MESSFVASIKKVSSAIMWSNLNLLFLLSLLPFGTKWMRETHFDRFTVLAYSILLMICSLSFNILQNKIAHSLKNEINQLSKIIKKQNYKVLISTICNVLSIPAAFINTNISLLLFHLLEEFGLFQAKKLKKNYLN